VGNDSRAMSCLAIFASGCKGRGSLSWRKFRTRSLSWALPGDSGARTAGDAWNSLADDFTRFVRSGFAKVAWNFRLRTESPGSTVLSTETRIKCFGQGALWAFRIYWSLVGPFSGLMRKAILKQVKSEAELQAKR
jgi:hypothetical protein